MAIKRVVSRMPDPVIGNLKSLVGQLARSKVFSEDGSSITQEQTVALCIQLVSENLSNMTTTEIKQLTSGSVNELLGMYEEHKENV